MLAEKATRGQRRGSRTRMRVQVVEGGEQRQRPDELATEEPLEIRLIAGGEKKTVAVTMRTPGADFELAAGFLFCEGIISSPREVLRISYCVDPKVDPEQQFNIVNVELRPGSVPDLRSLERHFYTTSACGVCGKASLEALASRGCSPLPPGPSVTRATIHELPHKLNCSQRIFASTGGLHAAGLFSSEGTLLALREDVGRHNAVDKLLGWALLGGRLPLHDHVVMVSGRSSYEIMQKCLAARVPVVASVSAPSSLAVDLARGFGMTLIGFVRDHRFNVYSGAGRIVTGSS